MPGHPVEAVDATGAGDTFDGVFLARLLAGDDLKAAARYATSAAALSTKGYGAVTPIPRAAEVQAELARRKRGVIARRKLGRTPSPAGRSSCGPLSASTRGSSARRTVLAVVDRRAEQDVPDRNTGAKL